GTGSPRLGRNGGRRVLRSGIARAGAPPASGPGMRYHVSMSLDERARTPADVSVAEMEKLLAVALERGGDFADLYFEHDRSSSLLLEESILRTASARVT